MEAGKVRRCRGVTIWRDACTVQKYYRESVWDGYIAVMRGEEIEEGHEGGEGDGGGDGESELF